jgi:hypothetical protein
LATTVNCPSIDIVQERILLRQETEMFSDCVIDGRKAVSIPIAWRWLCATAAAVMILSLFYFGAQPVAVGMFMEPWDKLAHLITFAVLATLLWMGTAGRWPLMIVCLVALVGGLDEWHQAYLPGRHGDIGDFLSDAIATAMTVFLLHPRQQ